MYGYSPTQDAAAKVDENLFDQAANVVVGKIVAVEINRDDQDPDWDLRDFQYDLLVEAVEKGNLNRGETIQLKAWAKNWIGENSDTASWSEGHSPLPLPGERGRFFLSTLNTDAYEIVLPNGVELDPSADKTDPRRVGDTVPEVKVEVAEEEVRPTSKDPFGWDVILILLGIPFIVGAIRQKSRSRWGLLVVGALMFLAAVIITSCS